MYRFTAFARMGLMGIWGVGLAYAANVGDAVDPAVLTRLAIDPGKITVIDFFAEWCVSCRKELPLISQIQSRADARKVEFIGVDTDEAAKVADAFQAEMRAKGGLSFRVLNDLDQSLVRSLKPRGYPALYILKGGKVVRAHLGATPDIDALLEQDLKALGG